MKKSAVCLGLFLALSLQANISDIEPFLGSRKCSYDIPREICRSCGKAHLPGTPCPKK